MRRQSVCPRRLCAFHDNRLRHHRPISSRSPSMIWLHGWQASGPDNAAPVLYGEAHRSRALRAALCPAASGRDAASARPSTGVDPHHPPGRGQLHAPGRSHSICETGGCQYNSAIRGLSATSPPSRSRFRATQRWLTPMPATSGGSAADLQITRHAAGPPTGNRRLRRYRSPLAS